MGKSRTLSRARGHSGASAKSSRGHSGGDSWQAPSLTDSERAYMIRKAKEASVALVDHAHTLDGPVQWHYTGKFRGIQMYRGEGSYDRVGTNGTEFLCGVTTMMGTIEEVASYFDQQTTERMLAKKAEDVLDCGMLYSLVQGGPNNPYYRVSAKYQLYEGPSAFSRERDYCFLECQNTFRHASGRRGWVLSMHSIKLPNCPEVDGVVRGSMYQSGYVFVESEKEGYMDVMHSLQINFKSTSRLPHFLLNSALKRRILSVVTISREIQTSRMGRQTLLKKKDLMPKRARALCVNCSRKFSLFVRKTRCRVCGEVVCQPCAPQVMISTKRGPVKTRVCIKCYHLSPGDEYEPIGALPNSQNGGDPRRMQNETRYSDILQDHPDMYHDPDEDSMDEDEDEDGLEEQSDYSVFAQSRFTEASRDSVATSNFGASSHFESHFDGSSQFDATSELDDSQYYDGGDSESSFVSGTSTSNWQGGNSTASSMMGWNQASSVRPADGYIYDPQASMMTSNFYGASKYSESDCGAINYTVEEEREKRTGKYKAAAPIPEDEPDSRNGYTISPNTSYNSSQNTNYNSGKASKFKSTQGTNYDASHASYNSNASHVSKTVSIQSLAKARSARYGIKSHFPPPPPPPPPLSPPPEADEDREDDSPLHLGALKSDKTLSSKDRKPKGIAARKMFTPPPPKEGLRENGLRKSTNRAPKAPPKEYSAAQAGTDSRISQASSRDSHGFSSTRSSAILQQMRRNRNRTIQLTPDSDRSSAVLKTLEEEHLNRMREIERLQDLAKEKAARRSMASNGSRSSLLSDQPSQTGGRGNNVRASAAFAAAVKKTTQPRHNGPSSPTPGSLPGPPPGSPPGTPPSMRGRRMPPFNQQANQSFGSRSRHTDTNSDFGGSRFLSTRSNGTFAQSNVRVSVAPSAQSEELVFNSQPYGFQASKGSNSSSRGRRFDASQASSKSINFSFGGRRLDVSQTSGISMSKTPDNLAFDASQLSVDKSKFSSSIAILETPDDMNDHVAMMERLSSQRGSSSSTHFDEDLLAQSSVGIAKHINSMRARAPYQLPDEEDRVSDELLKRQQEHRRRMEELTKLTANHVEDNIRDSASSLGDLHDSSISLNGFRDNSGNHFGDSSVSSASSVDIDDDEFDFESRPLGRTKRSGTIPFSLEEMEQVPDANEDEELSEGPDDSDTSFRLSEDPMEHEHDSDKEDAKVSYRSSEEFLEQDGAGSTTNVETSSHPRANAVDHDHPDFSSSETSSEHEHPPTYRTSEDCVEHEHVNESVEPDYRSSEDPTDYNHENQRAYRPSEESMEHKPTNDVRPDCRSSEESIHEGRLSEQGHEEAANRVSEESVESQSESKNSPSAHRLSEESIERKSEVEAKSSAFRLRKEQKGEHGEGEPSYFSSDESEPEDADAEYRSSEEPVAPQTNGAKFQPHTSQLIPGEGGAAVDEFFADSSRLLHNEKLSQVDERGDGDEDTRSPRDTSEFHEDDLRFIPEEHSTHDFKQPLVSSSTISTEGSEHIGSPRESCASALDESLMNRPTEELFEQVRANRLIYSNGSRSSNLELHDLEASHIRRMEELNRIALDHLGNRISNLDDDMFGSSYQPGRSLYPQQPKLDDDEEEMQWRSTDVMEEYQGKHEQDMERLRRKIRQLEEECRESIASVLTPEEMDLSEFDIGDEEPMSAGFDGAQSANAPQSHNPQSSFVFTFTKNLSSSTLSQPMPLQVDEPGSARALYDQIAKLTQLQREMAMAENDDDEEEYRARIKEQYRLLRTIKAASNRLRITEPRSPRKTTSWQPTVYEALCTESESKTSGTTAWTRSFSRTATNTAAMTHVSALDESCVSAFDESLMNRPTEELFEQVRANRPKASADAVRSSDLQLHDLEASHNRRMQELNRIALDQLGNRISNLGHDRLSGSYYPQSSQLTVGKGGMEVDEFFAGSSVAAASTSGKLAQVAEQRDDREEDARSSRETSGSQQDIDEEQRSTSMSASETESERESAAKSATEVKLDQFGNRISNLGHDRRSGSYYPQSSQLTAGEGGMTVDEFFAGSSVAAASTSGKLAQVAEQCDDREEDARSSRETSGSQQDIDEEQRSTSMSASETESERESAAKSATEVKLDQFGNRISNLGHDRRSGSYYPQSSQLTAGEGGMAVDEFFAGSSVAAASTSGKLAQVAEQRDDREEDARSSRETSGSQRDIDEEQRSTSMSASETESERESAAKSATEVKSSSVMSRSSTSSSAALKSDQASVAVSDIVVASNVLASSALSMSALSSSAVATGTLTKSANATNTAAMTHVSALDESCVSAFDESLMNRPTEELFEQVRANRPKASADAVRSSDLQLHDLEASHNRRMQELNRIALDQLGNRISNLGHDRLSGSYYPQSSQLAVGEGGMAVDEFFAGSSVAAASTSGKLAQVAEQRDDREEDARSSRETSGSQRDIDEEQRSTSMSASETESERESAAKSATEVKSSSVMSRSSTSSSAALKSDQASVAVSDIVVASNVLASSALSMSALSSSAVATGTLTKSANATNTAAMTHVSALDESCVSAFDESLMNRPTEELFEQVRANRPKASADAVRSSDLQLHDLEASHNRRMQELNRIALDQLGNRISNLGHDRLSGSYYPQSSQLAVGEGGMAVDEFFAGSSVAAASTSGKLAQVAEQRDDREEDARSSRETSGSQRDIDEEQRSTSMSASETESERESAAKSATEVKSSSVMSRSSTSSSAALKSDQASVAVSDIVVASNVLASSALSMSALSSSAVATGTLTKSANATNTAAMTHVSALDESCVSAFDESLMNRPTEELFEQVRANRPKASADAVRSSDLQLHDLEASHNRRMQELNRIALDQLGNRISNLGHDRLSGSYYPQSSQLAAGEGGMAVDEFFAGSSVAAASTSGKLAQVAEQRDDREEDARSSRETSGSQQDIDEEQRSTSMSASETESERESAAKSATEVKSSSVMSRSSTSSSAALKSDQASVAVSDIVVASNVLASSALSMSALSSSAVATGTLTKSANATNTAAMTHVSALDESCVSAFDESLMNRPTEELFEQVRANRPKASADAVRSSDLQLHDLEASHNRRMQELNRIALDQLGNRISNLGHDRLSGSYYPQSSQLAVGEGGMAVDEFFAGSSVAAASTSGKLAQVAEQRDDREEDARSSRETSGSQQDIDEEQRSTSMSASETESERESAAKSATEVKSSSVMSRSSTSSSAALKSDQASVAVSDIVVASNVLASSALSMSALSSSAVATGTLTKSANATNTAAMTHVSALDESCVSAFDESLMNRPTEELFEQVRANRPKASADAVRSSDLQLHDLEASHNRRMQELNRIALDQLGNRISNLYRDGFAGSFPSLRSIKQNEDREYELQTLSNGVVNDFKSRNEREVENLRRKIRQLEREVLESSTPTTGVKEMKLSDLDDADENPKRVGFSKSKSFNAAESFQGNQSFNPQSSFISIQGLSSSALRPLKSNKRGPSRAFHDKIAKMTVTEL